MSKYQQQYLEKKTTAEGVAARFRSNWVIATDLGITIPYAMMNAVGKRAEAGEISNLTVHTNLDLLPMPCYDERLKDSIYGVSWFMSGGARKAVNGGYGDLMPNYFRDMAGLYRDYTDIDAYCAVVSPMDKHGYFTPCNGANSMTFLQKAKYIFLEVNENMPRIPSSTLIHISQVTALFENNVPLPELPPNEVDEVSLTIGGLIAEEIPNGATIQLGIGAIPNAVGQALKGKCGLGIHSEMFTESMVDLIECGAVDNRCKPIHTGRTVATFALGTRRLYDYLDDNPSVDMLPASYVNDPKIIAQHPNFCSVNAAVEVDFMGQVCAESFGPRPHSGTGGQVDFVRGAIESSGGKSFIAFPSTAKGGSVSRIMPVLTTGAIVTTSKNDADHIVTEYGIAKLRGKTFSQRTRALIEIAHPKFRDELLFAAKKQNII